MNIWVKILPILLLFLFTPVIAEARSGCCSGHGGVNCGAGAQGNGNVICNDGWRGSSCLYSEMVMCGGSSTTSTQYTNTVRTVLPTNTPIPPTKIPVRIITKTPTKIPTPTSVNTPTVTLTNTPTPTLTPTPLLTETLSPTNTPTVEPTITSTPTSASSPQVMGATDTKSTQSSGGGFVGGLFTAGLIYGAYKLIKRFKK